ncbi:MAG: carboxypeptidase-like regulatory domain-containing protein, partial [Candidatus Sulfotelmatobacter sp.]
MKHRLITCAIFLLTLGVLLGVVLTTPANADNLYASIRGTVVDPTGAVVPDAKLTATNVATGLAYNTISDKDGLFSFLQLPIGDYSVRAERSGFKTVTENRIHLDLDQIFNLKVAMELGTTSETITVEANPAQVETTSMQLGTTITGNQIVDLPLNGRNWTQLMQLQPGVQGGSDRFGTSGTLGAYSTNGAETQQNNFLINGTDSNDVSLNTPLVIPSPDAIGEFDLVTSTINPEYGRNSGAIVNAAIKNGTNQFHGDAFEFYRDTFLDAIPWFQNTRAL